MTKLRDEVKTTIFRLETMGSRERTNMRWKNQQLKWVRCRSEVACKRDYI